jgi:hypothetical protein
MTHHDGPHASQRVQSQAQILKLKLIFGQAGIRPGQKIACLVLDTTANEKHDCTAILSHHLLLASRAKPFVILSGGSASMAPTMMTGSG